MFSKSINFFSIYVDVQSRVLPVNICVAGLICLVRFAYGAGTNSVMCPKTFSCITKLKGEQHKKHAWLGGSCIIL